MSHNQSRLCISVVTVCLNARETIAETIHSVENQTYPTIEYVIIDGGSIDGTKNIVQQNRERVHTFISEEDRGVFDAMNKGIRHTNGDVLFFLNADDYFADDDVVKDIAAVFNEDPAAELVFGNQIFDHGGRRSRKKQSFSITRKQLARMTIQHQTIFARNHLFQATGGFSENYRIVSDYEWILKVFLGMNCRYKYIDRDISVMSTGGLSWSENFEKERRLAMKNYFTYWERTKWRAIPLKYQKLKQAVRAATSSRSI